MDGEWRLKNGRFVMRRIGIPERNDFPCHSCDMIVHVRDIVVRVPDQIGCRSFGSWLACEGGGLCSVEPLQSAPI